MLIELIIKGGPVMIPIILGSIVALALILERIWTLWRMRLNYGQFAQEIFFYLEKGQYQKALDRCEKIKHPMGDLYKLGILNRGLKRDALESILENEGNEQVQGLERYLGALMIIVGIEPMLGFLGTITGLIKAFMNWEQMGANITVNLLAGGIYEAMITTAAGLIVAIPGYVIYHLIVNKIKGHSQEMTYYGNELIDILSSVREIGGREGGTR